MRCNHCARDIEADSSYCRYCGSAPGNASSPRRLYRQPAGSRIAGVCAGIAEYLGTDVTLIRLVWVVLSVVPGGIIGGVIVYVAAWIVMPEAGAPSPTPAGARRLTRSTGDQKIAGVCGGIAEYLGIDPTIVRVAWVVLSVVPGCIVGGLIAYLIAWFIMPLRPLETMTPVSSPA